MRMVQGVGLKCSVCGAITSRETGHSWTEKIILCRNCAIDWFDWYRQRMFSMYYSRDGSETFGEAAEKSIK